MPVHHLNLDANTIVTPGLIEASSAIRNAVKHRGMAAIHGMPGVGKSFATAATIETLGLDIETREIEARERIGTKGLALAIWRALTGTRASGSLREIDEQLLETVLPGREFLLVIDEAQQLDRDCFEYVRRLWDARQKALALRDETAFAVAFVGGHRCFETLFRHQMLRRRIGWWAHIQPLEAETVLAEIPKLHPLLARADAETLLWINDEYAHGQLGWWADFLVKANDVCSDLDLDTVTDEVTEAVLATRSAMRLIA